jgi:hypothetical protein
VTNEQFTLLTKLLAAAISEQLSESCLQALATNAGVLQVTISLAQGRAPTIAANLLQEGTIVPVFSARSREAFIEFRDPTKAN